MPGSVASWQVNREIVKEMIRRTIQILTEYPRTVLLAWLLFTAVVSCGVRYLAFDFSPESVYSGQDEAVAFCEKHKRLFRFEDSICLVVLESTDERTLLRPDCFQWMRSLESAVKAVPGVQRVSSLLTLERPVVRLDQAAENPDEAMTWVPLFSESDLSSEATVQDRLDRVPLLNDLLISQDRRLLLTLVALDPERRGIANITPSVSGLEEVLGRIPLPENTRAMLSGVPPIRVDIIRSLQQDQYVMVPLSAVLFVALSLLIFRSLSMTLLSLFAVMCPVALTVGVMGWVGQPFNLLSNIVPTMSLIIGAANTVHIVSRFQAELARRKGSLRESVCEVMSEMSVTCLLTLGTTAVGFGSLWLARSTLLQALALQAMLAMFWNYVGLLTVLTAGLVIYGPSVDPVRQNRTAPRLVRRLHLSATLTVRRLGHWIVSHAGAIVVSQCILLMAALLWSWDTRVNSMMFETYEADHAVMRTVRLLDEKLSGMISLELQLQAQDRDDFFRHDTASAVRRLRTRMEADPRVTFCRDYTQILQSFDSRIASDSDETSAAALARVGRLLDRVDVSRITRDFLATDRSAARVMLRVHDIGSAGLKELIADIRQQAEQELPADIGFQITGDAALHAVCMDVFVRDLFVSLLSASGIIFAMIALLFRSLKTGLLATMPNLMPLVLTLAWMKVRGFELNAGNVIVFAVSLGIAVDDTIHFLARFRELRKVTPDAQVAVYRTVVDCGKAIILTSVLIVLGLSVLGFSEFVPTRRFAELTAITMASALPGDLILLPALLALTSRHRS
jgi:predicted RND superfamily exporter protein